MAAPGAHSSAGSLVELIGVFLRLGCTSFGGPVAHLGYFRSEFVVRRKWLAEADYADLVALCQFLPGPASSEVAFAIGMQRAGWLGALAASVAFVLPSAAMMIAGAYGIAALADLTTAGWLHGLKLAAVAVVAHAVIAMARQLCTDWPRRAIACVSAGCLIAYPGGILQIAALASGGFVGWLVLRSPADVPLAKPEQRPLPLIGAVIAAGLFVALLIGLPIAASLVDHRLVDELDAFYRAGALVFGGGHVVLPLLNAEVVGRGWIGHDQFLAGYGAAQAVPGPLFSFGGFLGAAIAVGVPRWLNGAICLGALFLPGWLAVAATLPVWHRLRTRAGARAAMSGANAAVVGLLAAALYDPVGRQAIFDYEDGVVAAIGFALLWLRVPAWAVALALAGCGQWLIT